MFARIQAWLDDWYEIGFEAHREGMPIPMRATVARVVIYTILRGRSL